MLQGKAIPALSKEEGNKKPVPESEQILTDATFFGPGKPGMVSFNEVNICRSNGPKRDLCLNFFSGGKSQNAVCDEKRVFLCFHMDNSFFTVNTF